ncbi:hypothetical protein TPHA_0B01980 [Tetrapisispora phaffii CBS 4417]|uniref:RNA helicase n=1 Tax=Tetrapisispora phaffii (strain ATCC 24235 / CBS 4417 / NBRC 1672 / NRRL Y-8282 / UCD 70-5) TaxID=1071381 RepID=G8BPD9_TETPH|nr:hypothetical protein TPHA_0B01980 [Tetrapisispora phaffii CBS 4417]CCE61870.1 hypothetical protein TPHA_0B01980 [Tetrapisispora phaffii CBS 4417]
MAKKGKSSSKVSTPVIEKVDTKKSGKKGKKGKSEEPAEYIDPKEANRAKQQQNRAKVTSTASWTGKLPHTILHENCQKRKWNKVEYDMKRIGDKGLVATAVISYTDPKTKEVITIKMHDPTYDKTTGKGLSLPQETPMEARHIAATIALYRIAYNTNMQMMLPPNHKNLWYDLSDYRKDLLESNPKKAATLFDVDPFKSTLEERKKKEQQEKERDARFQQSQKENKRTIVISINSSSEDREKNNNKSSSKSKNFKSLNQDKINSIKNSNLVSFPRKVWDNATFIDLSETTRQLIEVSLKHYINWNYQLYNDKYSTPQSKEARKALENKLLSLNFRKPHVTEAMQYQDPLSFLLFNLPEDDLPPFFHKRKEDSDNVIEIAKLPLATRNIIDRLGESGLSKDVILLCLEQCNFNEAEAAGMLTLNSLPSLKIDKSQYVSEEGSRNMWDEELESLKSIYGDSIEINNKEDSLTMVLLEKFHLKVKFYKTKYYPSTLPGIIVSTLEKSVTLPNYIKQQIILKLLHYIQTMELLNDMMLYNIYEWLVDNVPKIIENPGSLLSDGDLEKSLLNNSKEIKSSTSNKIKKKNRSQQNLLTDSDIANLKLEYQLRMKSTDYQLMKNNRMNLPAWKEQQVITDLCFQNDVILITGETGSGKSTQVVQFILDHLVQKGRFQTKIICTQPRRISAIGLAERVSEERCTSCGDEVGYVIRGINKTNDKTRIKFMTTGVLVRILQTDINYLRDSIIVIDEVHERSIDTDLVVILLKNLLEKVKGLKIILMSATVNVDVFKTYFKNLGQCHIEGRTYPIKDYFLEDILTSTNFTIEKAKGKYEYDDDVNEAPQNIAPSAESNFFKSGNINYDLISELIVYIDQQLKKEQNDGSVIVFLPGVAEINKCCRMLESNNKSNEFVVLPLHSALTPEEQKRVFKKFGSKRKIVVSTNIAETSITIDDCVATVDSGRAKTMLYNSRDNTTRLVEAFISKAEAKQRRGRAGRVREGLSFRLYSKRLYEEDMVEMPTPEIRRTSLESLYLSVKSMGVKDVKMFLSGGLDPPPTASLKKAEDMLTTVGLLKNEDNSLTQLGQFISLMPVMDSKHGKLLIYSIIFGCADLGVLIVSTLSGNSLPFLAGVENRDKVRAILSKNESLGDVLSTVLLLKKYISLNDSTSKRNFMKENFLSFNKVSDIMSSRTQFYSILKDVGFLPMNYRPGSSDELNVNENNLPLIKSILAGAFYPNITRVELPDAKFASTSVGAIEKNADAKLIKYWIRNENYIQKLNEVREKLKSNPDFHIERDQLPLPATKSFIHPSSVLFSTKSLNEEEMESLSLDYAPVLKNKNTEITKYPFLVFTGSFVTSKLFLKDITPTSTLAVLLFGGPINYETNGATHSQGIVVDDWLPIRTWCKNGVLMKELRNLLDTAIKEKLINPQYTSGQTETSSSADVILKTVQKIITIEQSK